MKGQGTARACVQVVLAAVAASAVGCATAAYKPIADAPGIELADGLGILVLHTSTSNPKFSVVLDGGRVVADFTKGDRIRLFVMPEGVHRITQVRTPRVNGYRYWEPRIEAPRGEGMFELRQGQGHRRGCRVRVGG